MKTMTLLLAPILLLSTTVHAQYCMLPGQTPYSTLQPGITNFKLNTINRTSSNSESSSAVVVTTGMSTTLSPGQTYTIFITHSEDNQFFPGARNNLRVWLDYNGNFSFTDPGETILSKDLEFPATTYSAVFTVPGSAQTGTFALRATAKMSSDAGHTLPTPCNVPADPLGYHGEMEDYTVLIGNPGMPFTAFTVSSPTVCQTGTVNTNNTSVGSPAPAFSWSASPSGVTFSPNAQATDPVLSFAGPGIYTVTCVSTNSAGTSYATKTVQALVCGQAPAAMFSVNTPTLCKGQSITVTNSSTGTPAPSYAWSVTPSSGVSFSPGNTDPNPVITFALFANYTITCTASNSVSSSSSSKTVSVKACTGLDEESLNGWSLSPNPASDRITVRPASQTTGVRITVNDISGRIVFESSYQPAEEIIVEINQLQEGVYYMNLEQGNSRSGKLFIRQ
jgi:PKD repeat protein